MYVYRASKSDNLENYFLNFYNKKNNIINKNYRLKINLKNILGNEKSNLRFWFIIAIHPSLKNCLGK